MLFVENIILAISAIRANRIRSLLTMLGIIIGISSVITIMSIGNLLTEAATTGFFYIETMDITVGITKRSSEDDPEENFFLDDSALSLRYEDKLKPEEIQDIMDHFPDDLTGYGLDNDGGEAVIRENGRETKVSIKGKNNKSMKDKKLKLLAGREFTDLDQEQSRLVAVISDKALRSAYKMKPEEALGQDVTVIVDDEFQHFTIVGVYYFDEKAAKYNLSGTEVTEMYIPVRTSFVTVHEKEAYPSVNFSYDDDTSIESLMNDIDEYINNRYYHDNKMFRARSYSDTTFIKQVERVMNTVSIVVAVIAGISLMVGGIGVMNIMLVSIQERTREIGTRKALGATNSLILMQFIAEAIMLCLVGGLIGCGIGLFFGNIATIVYNIVYGGSVINDGGTFTPVKFQIPYAGVFVSLLFSSLVGIFFGYYPAKKAADMNPIDALRYE